MPDTRPPPPVGPPGAAVEPPSPWVRRWAPAVPAGATLLDLACGRGRHLRLFVARGCRVTGVDRDPEAIADCPAAAETLVADLETGPWPLEGRAFDAVVVANYLWRPRLPELLATVAPGGMLIYETFAAGQETIGRPARPAFLLQPGELLAVVAGWRVVAFEDGFEAPAEGAGPGRHVQRIVAVRPGLPAVPAPALLPASPNGTNPAAG